MRKLTIIGIEWNFYNGFELDFIAVEINDFEGQLFSIWASKDHFEFSIMFVHFIVKSPI